MELRHAHPDEDHEALQRRFRIANAIFLAADIDLQTFARSHLPPILDLARRTEVYVSENDGALQVSAILARASRLGRPNFDELSREDLATLANNERLVGIDVTGVYGAHELTGMRGHGYWIANQRVSSDVLLSMVYPFDPAWRGLVHGPGRGLWNFPDDYPERVGGAVHQAVPELRLALTVAGEMLSNRARPPTTTRVHFAGRDSALADVDFVFSSVVYSTMAWASLAASVVIENVTGVSACVHMPAVCFSGYVTRTAFWTAVDPAGLPAVADPAE